MANEAREFFDVKGMKVGSVRRIPGTEVITFSLSGKGLSLYGLRIVKGARGSFISAPQTKGKDGKYYDQYHVYFAEADEERVIKAVIDKLPKDEPAGDTL